jgi:hypothetical protein
MQYHLIGIVPQQALVGQLLSIAVDSEVIHDLLVYL